MDVDESNSWDIIYHINTIEYLKIKDPLNEEMVKLDKESQLEQCFENFRFIPYI